MMPISPNESQQAKTWFLRIDEALLGEPPVSVEIPKTIQNSSIVNLAINVYSLQGWIVRNNKNGNLTFTIPETRDPRD